MTCVFNKNFTNFTKKFVQANTFSCCCMLKDTVYFFKKLFVQKFEKYAHKIEKKQEKTLDVSNKENYIASKGNVVRY